MKLWSLRNVERLQTFQHLKRFSLSIHIKVSVFKMEPAHYVCIFTVMSALRELVLVI